MLTQYVVIWSLLAEMTAKGGRPSASAEVTHWLTVKSKYSKHVSKNRKWTYFESPLAHPM